MKNRKEKQVWKKGCAGLLAAVVLAAGIGGNEMSLRAAEPTTVYGTNGTYTYKDDYVYDESTRTFQTTWTEEGTGQAPVKDGYVFGGWCIKNDGGETYTMLTKETAKTALANSTPVYAKFVPAYVLSVRAQVDGTTYNTQGDRTNAGSIRLVSSTDSKGYQKVGFTVLVNNKNQVFEKNPETGEKNLPLETTNVYNKLQTVSATEPYEANQVFGTKSKYFSVWRLDKISVGNDAKIMSVTPYWITPDGTKVDGLTKYVHMEDGYKDHMYVGIPVTLLGDTSVAAGILTVTYPSNLSLIDTNAVEYGKIFPEEEMEYYNDAANHVIKFAGNAGTVGEGANPSGLLVNLRFKRSTTNTGFLNFNVGNKDFSAWNENDVSVDTWDIQY